MENREFFENIELSEKEFGYVRDSLKAFISNFGKLRIGKADYRNGYYIYSPADSEDYVVYCYSLDNLDGWLWGCVQAVNKRVKLSPEREALLSGLQPEKPTVKYPCRSCIYFDACGSSTRTEPCSGRVTAREQKREL